MDAREPAREFWPGSLWRSLERDASGRHRATDAYWRAWLARPELQPPEEAGPAERALHAALLAAPRRPITPVALLALEDADARENWSLFAAFRDHLLAHATLEEAYLALFLDPAVKLPALFADELARAILRGILDRRPDPFRCRAAECLFRPQLATIREGAVLLADAETVRRQSRTGGLGELGALLREAGAALRQPKPIFPRLDVRKSAETPAAKPQPTEKTKAPKKEADGPLPEITIEEFLQAELRVARVLEAELADLRARTAREVGPVPPVTGAGTGVVRLHRPAA